MTIDFNREPYWDDFSDDKNFYRILFRPGYAVQARELTQLQTTLQDQIAKFGSSIYQQGSVVIPGNSYADLNSSYLRISSINSTNIDPEYFEGKKIIGESSGTRARVRKAVRATETDPIVFYIQSTSGGDSGQIDFDQGEQIRTVDDPTGVVYASIENSSEYTGEGTLAFINEGVYYISGYFVLVEPQSVVVSKFSTEPTASIGLRINEQIVTPNDDPSLLDNARGTYNYAAPGGHRYYIDLTLISKGINESDNDDFVELIRYVNGELKEHLKTPQYSELEKSLARRTFDESGNYIVEGTYIGVREHLKGGNNRTGIYPPPKGDNDKLVVEVSSGKAYVNGFEVNKLGKSRVEIDKARTSEHIKTTDLAIRPEFGQYIIVGDLTGSLELQNREQIDIYDVNDPYASDATQIGSARVYAIDFLIDNPGSVGSIHKLWVSEIEFEPGYSIEDAGGIAFGTSDSALVLNEYRVPVTSGTFTPGELITHSSGRSATVEVWDAATGTLYAYRHDNSVDVPLIGDGVVGSSSETNGTIQQRKLIIPVGDKNPLVFKLGKNAPFSFLDPETGSYNLRYTVQKELVITTDGNGDGSVSVTSGNEIDPIETGTFLAFGPSGIVDDSLFSLNSAGSTLTLNGGPSSSTVRVYAAVTKTNLPPKTKTVTTKSVSFTNPGSDTLFLDDTDIISVESVIDDNGDITASYTLDTGQRDTVYLRGSLSLNSGSVAPSGNVTVNYTYYEHSISGDFFCIDSYPEDVLERNVQYRTRSEGKLYELPRCIDFRPSVGTNGEINGTNGRPNDIVLSGTTFRTKLQYYVPRIDLVTLTQGGNIRVISGTPSNSPSAPPQPKNELSLETLYIPEYTKAAQDVRQKRLSVDRYRMKDIQNIDKRIDNIEYFATLTAQELEVTNFDVIDAETGLNRFKTGYLVESFKNAFLTARTTSPDFAANFVGKEMEAPAEQEFIELQIDGSNSSHVVDKNGYVMLPYTEVTFASQNLSSRTTNLNPFLVISWDGILEVDPAIDEWVEVRDRPTIFEEETEVNKVTTYIECPPDSEPPEPDEPDDPEPEPDPEDDSGESTFLFEVTPSFNGLSSFTFDTPIGETYTEDYTITAVQGSGTVDVQETRRPSSSNWVTTVDGNSNSDFGYSYGYNSYDLSEGESITVSLGVTNSEEARGSGTFKFFIPFGTDPSKQYEVDWVGNVFEKAEEDPETSVVIVPTGDVKDDDSVDEGDIFSFDIQVNNYTTSNPRETTLVYWYVNFVSDEVSTDLKDLDWLGGAGSTSTTTNLGYADVEYEGDTNNGLAKGPSFRVVLDQKTESPELFTVEVRKNVNSGILATRTFTINDTSKNQPPPPPPPPEPVQTSIGWYGAVVGRDERNTPSDAGAEWWTSDATNSSAEDVAERFLEAAERNYTDGDEDIYNEDALDPSDVSKKDILTGTATYDPETGQTTITGITLEGRSITKTVEGKVDSSYM